MNKATERDLAELLTVAGDCAEELGKETLAAFLRSQMDNQPETKKSSPPQESDMVDEQLPFPQMSSPVSQIRVRQMPEDVTTGIIRWMGRHDKDIFIFSGVLAITYIVFMYCLCLRY